VVFRICEKPADVAQQCAPRQSRSPGRRLSWPAAPAPNTPVSSSAQSTFKRARRRPVHRSRCGRLDPVPSCRVPEGAPDVKMKIVTFGGRANRSQRCGPVEQLHLRLEVRRASARVVRDDLHLHAGCLLYACTDGSRVESPHVICEPAFCVPGLNVDCARRRTGRGVGVAQPAGQHGGQGERDWRRALLCDVGGSRRSGRPHCLAFCSCMGRVAADGGRRCGASGRMHRPVSAAVRRTAGVPCRSEVEGKGYAGPVGRAPAWSSTWRSRTTFVAVTRDS